jgi:two-component system nitrate/nitrite response regulator NarL
LSIQPETIHHDASPGIRILIADPNALYREALQSLLSQEPGLSVVGIAANGREAVKRVRELRPDILLLDMLMTDPSALETLRRIERDSVPVRTIVFANKWEKVRIMEALKLGARGVMDKRAAIELVFKSIRAVASGEYWLARDSISDLVRCVRATDAPPGSEKGERNSGLTPRELDIVNSVVDGFSNKDIAQKLSISEQTVKHHLTRIFEKTGVANRLELALLAMQGPLHD